MWHVGEKSVNDRAARGGIGKELMNCVGLALGAVQLELKQLLQEP